MGIVIRRAKVGDGKKFVEYWNESFRRGSFLYTGTNEMRSKGYSHKADKKYSDRSSHNIIFFAIDSDTDKIVGACHASGKDNGRLRHRLDAGWSVHPDYMGRGIATSLLRAVINEAKKHKSIKRMEAEAAVANVASWKLAKKCGFKIEGVKKKGLLTDKGKCIDTYILGRTL